MNVIRVYARSFWKRIFRGADVYALPAEWADFWTLDVHMRSAIPLRIGRVKMGNLKRGTPLRMVRVRSSLTAILLGFVHETDQFTFTSKLTKHLIPSRARLSMTDGQWAEIVRELRWVWNPITVKQPMSTFVLDDVEYFLPNDGLANITLVEYAFADMAYTLYLKKRKAGAEREAQDWLDRLVSYLCRPQDPNANPDDAVTWKGDYREQFNTDLCDRRRAQLARLPDWMKLLVLLHFAACKADIHRKHKGKIFIEEEPGTEVHGSKPMAPDEWITIAFSLSGGKFGTLEQTMYTSLSLILRELSRR